MSGLWCSFGVIVVVTITAAWAIQNQMAGAIPEAVSGDTEPASAAIRPAVFPVSVRLPEPPAGIQTGVHDRLGNDIRLTCRNCHDIRSANTKTTASLQLDEFHQSLSFNHGQLACVACHNSLDGYTTLHLADGTAVEYSDTMKLCAQCHGTQHRDYQHGSHGGMRGYWDLSRGPRQRNHCIDCHDPHAPQFPALYPAPGPADRFLPSVRDTVH